MALIQQEHPWHCTQVPWSLWAPRGPAQALRGAGTSIHSILWHQCPWNLAPDSLTPLKCCLSRDTQHRGQQKATSSNGVPAGGLSQLYQCVFRGHRMWLFYTAIVLVTPVLENGMACWPDAMVREPWTFLHIRKQEPPAGWLWVVDARWVLPELESSPVPAAAASWGHG